MSYDKAKDYIYTNANRMFVLAGVPLVLTIGAIGNAGFLFVLYRVKPMRNITNFYLANLSIADSCLLVMSSFQYFWTYAHSPLDVNFVFATSFGCAVPNFLVYWCYFASVWLVTLVATERYMAICHPFQHHIVTGKSRSVRLVVIAWGVAFIMTCFAAPYGNPEVLCIDWPIDESSSTATIRVPVCRSTCAWCDKALYAIDPAQFIIAFLINTCMYGKIVWILSRRTLPNQNGSSPSTQASIRLHAENRNQVARMLVVNTIVFFVCLFPYCVTNLNSLLNEIYHQGFLTIEEKLVLSWISKLTTLLNSAANPYLYSLTNKRYRESILQALSRKEDLKSNYNYRRGSSFVYTKGSTVGETKV